MSQERFALDTVGTPAAAPAESRLPRTIKPMLAASGQEPFDSPSHLFEVKWDGVRAIAFIEEGRVRLHNRYLRDITAQYPEFRGLGRRVKGRNVALDGEIVALEADGRPSFQLLQQRLGIEDEFRLRRLAQQVPVAYQVFDVLYWDGRSLMGLPLWRRKNLLHQIVRPDNFLQAPDFVEREGVAFFEAAREHELEGVIAKERSSPYRPGQRSPDWLKLKVFQKEEFVIGGYTFGGGRRKELFGALLLGLHDRQGNLVHVGDVGGGFTDKMAREVLTLLDPLQTPHCPFANPPRLPRLLFWCRPELVCQVKFSEWTRDGKLRFPVFVTVRPDVPPAECLLEHVLPSP